MIAIRLIILLCIFFDKTVFSIKSRQDEAFASHIAYDSSSNTFQSRSRVECSVRCVEEKCASYFYNLLDKICQLNNHGSFEGLTVIAEGWQLYRVPVNGAWTEWTSWSPFTSCTKTCATGTQSSFRYRSCISPSPLHGGTLCIGADSEENVQDCNTMSCPINGGWSGWGSWSVNSACTTICDEGTQQFRRLRYCNNPSPQYGGANCPGQNSQTTTHNCVSDICYC